MSKLPWKRMRGSGNYVAGEYTIKWSQYGSRRSWDVYFQGVRIPLSFVGRLGDAKQIAQKHADEVPS